MTGRKLREDLEVIKNTLHEESAIKSLDTIIYKIYKSHYFHTNLEEPQGTGWYNVIYYDKNNKVYKFEELLYNAELKTWFQNAHIQVVSYYNYYKNRLGKNHIVAWEY